MKKLIVILIVCLINCNSFSQDKFGHEFAVDFTNGSFLTGNYLFHYGTPNISLRIQKQELFCGFVPFSVRNKVYGLEGGYRYYIFNKIDFIDVFAEGCIKYLPYKSGPGPIVNINSKDPYLWGTENKAYYNSYAIGCKLIAFDRFYATTAIGYGFVWNKQRDTWNINNPRIVKYNAVYLKLGIGIKLIQQIKKHI